MRFSGWLAKLKRLAAGYRQLAFCMTDFFHRVSIIGLGLIGGSWGLALKDHGFAGVRLGYDQPEVLGRALERGAIDEACDSAADAAAEADLVILAAPVGVIVDLLVQVGRAVSPRALVTDVGSTKRLICQRAAEIFPGDPLFLGGHPLAGKERSGIENADARLFEGACYVLTPLTPDHLREPRVHAFCELVSAIGARPFPTDPVAHDRAVAYLSHLPQLVSTGLASLVFEQGDSNFAPLELAGTGFRDVSRLAESPYTLWRDICLTNAENVQAALNTLIEKLEHIRDHLTDRELEVEFRQALALRKRLPGTL
jgi:prephenate dehydrogenase